MAISLGTREQAIGIGQVVHRLLTATRRLQQTLAKLVGNLRHHGIFIGAGVLDIDMHFMLCVARVINHVQVSHRLAGGGMLKDTAHHRHVVFVATDTHAAMNGVFGDTYWRLERTIESGIAAQGGGQDFFRAVRIERQDRFGRAPAFVQYPVVAFAGTIILATVIGFHPGEVGLTDFWRAVFRHIIRK